MGEKRETLRPAGAVAFSALAAGCGDLAVRLLSPAETVFHAPLFVELFKHKARLIAATRLPEEKLLEALNELIESLQLIDAASIPVGVWDAGPPAL